MPFGTLGRRMKLAALGPSTTLALLALLVPPILVPVLAMPARAEEFAEHLNVPGAHLRLVNLVGEVRIAGHSGSGFEIDIHVRGKDANRERVRIEQKSGTVLVRFPLEEATHFVYPPMGSGSNTTIQWNPDRGQGEFGWKELLGLVVGRKIKVSGSGRGLELWADITVKVPKNGELALRNGVGLTAAEDIDGELDLAAMSGPIEARRLNGTLDADTGSGSVRVEDVNGDVVVDTGSGRVEVRNVTGSLGVDTGSGSVGIVRARGPRVSADTGSGSVTLSEIICDDLAVDTGSGNIEATGLSAKRGSLDTGSGGVELTFDRLEGGPFHIDTGSGSIRLALPTAASVTVEASTGSGGIQVEVPEPQWIRNVRHEKAFKIGGGDVQIVLETGSGSIHVRG